MAFQIDACIAAGAVGGPLGAGVVEAGVVEAGVVEAGVVEAGVVVAGVVVAGVVTAGVVGVVVEVVPPQDTISMTRVSTSNPARNQTVFFIISTSFYLA